MNLSSFWEVFASQTASWLVSGAETSTNRCFFVLPIDWYRFHCDQFSNEWGDVARRSTYIDTQSWAHRRYPDTNFPISLPIRRYSDTSIKMLILSPALDYRPTNFLILSVIKHRRYIYPDNSGHYHRRCLKHRRYSYPDNSGRYIGDFWKPLSSG